jgi:aminoglycoside phosphotransferase (APT) family kinase protein
MSIEKICNTNYEASVVDVLQRHLKCTPAKLIPVPTYPDTIVYEAQYPENPVIFKAIDPDGCDPDGIALEAWVCEKVCALGVPGPRVLAVDTSKSLFPGSYFVMEKASGFALNSLELTAEEQKHYVRLLGGYLRQVHAVKLDGFGWLDEAHYAQAGEVKGQEATWRTSVLKKVPASLEYLEREGAIDRRMIETVHGLIATHGEVLDQCTEASLLHGDLGDIHVWVDPERGDITSLVDFGERMAGDPVWDIIEWEWKEIDALLEGYEPDAEMKESFEVKFYLFAVLRAIPWAQRWYSRGAVQTIDWLKLTVQKAQERLGT